MSGAASRSWSRARAVSAAAWCGVARGGMAEALTTAIRWSWNLLSTDEQALLTPLCVFAGSFTLAAAEAVVRQTAERQELGNAELQTLIDAQLVQTHGTDKPQRYVVRGAIRSFVQEMHPPTPALRAAHATYFAGLVGPAVEGGDCPPSWIRNVDNLLTAAQHAQGVCAMRCGRAAVKVLLAVGPVATAHTVLEIGKATTCEKINIYMNAG